MTELQHTDDAPEGAVVDITESNLDDIASLSSEVVLDMPLFDQSGKHFELGENGTPKIFRFRLKRPTVAEGMRFDKLARGKFKSHKKIEMPDQLYIAFEALRICWPDAAKVNRDKLYNIIVRSGGYIGSQAQLVNTCLDLLGQRRSDEDELDEDEKRWADNEKLPT